MTQAHNTTFDFEYQGFESKKEEKIENHKRIKVIYSIKNAKEEICPYCKGNVSGYGKRNTRLVDIPYLPGESTIIDHIQKKEDEHNEKSTYRPYYLAIDEFAIRKGHRYATCVMDLVTGNILWVGKGRTINDFAKFFESYENSEYLSCVKAVAMDMNASYNRLVSQHFLNAEIVYDQYHVQSQFGRDVLGQVRLNAAKEHKRLAKEMISKDEIKREKRLYTTVKKARWILLSNGSNLKDEKKKCLNEILDTHSDIAVCYAMKEQMIPLFALTDTYTAQIGWTKWFDAAINSGIPPLVKFAKQK